MNEITLDRVDRRILNLLQLNNQLSARELADAVAVSAPTVLRRVRVLREAGVIESDVAMINPLALGYGLLAFVEVSLTSQSDDMLQAFEERVQGEAEVLQCYFVTGQYDYFLIVHVADMAAYYQFVRRVLSASGAVKHFESRFPMRRIKFNTALNLDEQGEALSLKLPATKPKPKPKLNR